MKPWEYKKQQQEKEEVFKYFNDTDFKRELKKISGTNWRLNWFYDTAQYINDRFNFYIEEWFVDAPDKHIPVASFVFTSKTGFDEYIECLKYIKEEIIKNGYTIENIFDMSFKEATEKWGLGESTLRNAITKNSKFIEGIHYKKSGNTWLTNEISMFELYGEPKK